MLPQKKKLLGRLRRRVSSQLDLQHTFALLSLICIGLISAASAIVLTRFLTSQLVERDAVVSREVIQAVADTERLDQPFEHMRASPSEAEHGVPEFFTHIATMPDVFRIVIYGLDRTIVWSSDTTLIGRRFGENEYLTAALAGEVVVKLSDREAFDKPEYENLAKEITMFVENYVPIWDWQRSRILGVVEIYRVPRTILEGIAAGRRLIWLTSASGAIFLYVTLFWIVRRAAVSLRAQQERLVEAETMAAVGEMASGIAHGIRNPLAAIRTSAELALEEDSSEEPSPSREAARDVIAEVDRLDDMIRDLIMMARQDQAERRALDVAEMTRCCVRGLEPVIKKQGIEVTLDMEDPQAPIVGDRSVLHLAINNVLSNALEAMPSGGRLAIAARTVQKSGDCVELTVSDSGQGMRADRIKDVFKPFVSSKDTGLGLGLSLTKRIIERHGGTIALHSELGKGTTVTIRLQTGGA